MKAYLIICVAVFYKSLCWLKHYILGFLFLLRLKSAWIFFIALAGLQLL